MSACREIAGRFLKASWNFRVPVKIYRQLQLLSTTVGLITSSEIICTTLLLQCVSPFSMTQDFCMPVVP